MHRFFRRWPMLLLGASLALNLLLGLRLAWRQPDLAGPPSFERLQAHMIKSLPEADRAPFDAALQADRPALEEAFRRAITSRTRADLDILAEPYDPAAALAALRRSNEEWHVMGDRFSETIVQALARISPEGRRAFVASMPPHKAPGKSKD